VDRRGNPSAGCDRERDSGLAPKVGLMSLHVVRSDLRIERNQGWFLARTLPSAELLPELRLEAQGFRTHVPQVLRTTRHSRHLRTVRALLFPRYLFIILDLGRDRWLSVRSTVGVSCLFNCDGRPVPVLAGIVEALMERTDGSGLTLFDRELAQGRSVRILCGPFADFVGTLQRLDAKGRVRVLLKMMGAAVPVALHRSALLPAA
jgi:transcription antitermination factor NusG